MALKNGKAKCKGVAWAPGHVFGSGETLPAPKSPNPYNGLVSFGNVSLYLLIMHR